MKTIRLTACLLLAAAAAATAQEAPQTLLEARRGFETKLQRRDRHEEPLEEPHPALFSLVRYKGPAGDLSAYVSKPSAPGRKAPAIIWITGGFPPGGASPFVWESADPENDQSAQAYRHAGVVMMYPTLRGSFGNGGVQESFLGEVDDVLAAADYLSGLDHVDSSRIYLGGHSTGGTLALLVAEATDRFKAVFAFGPVEDPAGYGQERLPYDVDDAREARVRAPIHFLSAVRSPTFVIEGEGGNIESLRALERASKNPALRFFAVKGADHFDVLAPINALIARKVASVESGAMTLDHDEVQAAFDEQRAAMREADDLETLASLRREGRSLAEPVRARHYLLSRERAALEAAAKKVRGAGFEPSAIEERADARGEAFYVLLLSKEVVPGDLQAVFAASKAVAALAAEGDAFYRGWDVE